MEKPNDLEMIEMSMEQAKEKVELMNSLQRIEANADFKKVFAVGYLEKYALRLVALKATLALQGEKDQVYINGQLGAIGHIIQYMQFIRQEGTLAADSILADEEERNLMLKEGGHDA